MEIDVVLPTLDPDIDRLDRAVSSILEQKETNPRLFVVDDSDSTSVEEYVARCDGDIEYIEGPGTTLAAALNEGIAAGDRELVARHDADDVSSRSRFDRQRQQFERDDDLDLLGTGAVVKRPSGAQSRRHVKEQLDSDDFEGGNPIVHGSVMARRDSLTAAGKYDERFYTSEDLELWLRMADQGMKLRNVDVTLYELHLHDDSVYASQLRETKLVGRLAEAYVSGRLGEEAVARVLDERDIEWVYEWLTGAEKAQLDQEIAMELLRYGEQKAARNHARKALEHDSLHSVRLGLLLLSYAPQPLVGGAVSAFRKFKNYRIKRTNS